MVENKKKIPVWVWVVMGILVIVIIYLYTQNLEWKSASSYCLERYSNKSLEIVNEVEKYGELGLDYTQLLICYQKKLPTCEPLIEKYGQSLSPFT
jgi:hypothetical protein